MSISFPSSTQYPSAQTSYQPGSAVSRLRQDVASLSSDLSSGDLEGAQQSFTDLQKLLQSNGVISSSSSAPSNTTASSSPASAFSSTLQNDFAQLGQDLSTGNLSGAQQDFSQLTSDAAAQQANSQTSATGGTGQAGGHHHHHHHAESSGDSDSSTSSTSANSSPTSTSSTQPTALQNDFNQLGQDLSSGNLSAVQHDFSQLTSDVSTAAGVSTNSSGAYSYASLSYTSTTQTINFVG